MLAHQTFQTRTHYQLHNIRREYDIKTKKGAAMHLSFCLYNKYITMLLDHLFPPADPTEMVIIRKDGKLQHIARPVIQQTDNDQSDKPFFPISKDRS